MQQVLTQALASDKHVTAACRRDRSRDSRSSGDYQSPCVVLGCGGDHPPSWVRP